MNSKKYLFLLSIAIVASIIIGYMAGYSHNKQIENRLEGYWNLVIDSLVIKRNTKAEFATSNLNFSYKTVELPLIQTLSIDFKGKTLLDADIDKDSLAKFEYYYQKAEHESQGTWELYNSKDSIRIHALSHPLNGNYKLCFFKTYSLGQEHYFMRISNDSTYIVCEKFFSGYINKKLLREWDSQ